jgi:hypothetical protein
METEHVECNQGYVADFIDEVRRCWTALRPHLSSMLTKVAAANGAIERRRRKQEEGYQVPALLLLDGLGSDHLPEFLQECERRNICKLFLVPHRSDQSEPLDLVTFS